MASLSDIQVDCEPESDDLKTANNNITVSPQETERNDDDTYSDYICQMPRHLQEQNFDVLIINADEDQDDALDFKKHLEKDIIFNFHDRQLKPRVKILAEIYSDGIGNELDFAFSKTIYVFLYVTKYFCKNDEALLNGHACLLEAIKDRNRKWCVIPVHTKSKKEMNYKLPMVLSSLRPIYYWSKDQFYTDTVRNLLSSKIGIRVSRDENLERERKQYFEENKELLRQSKYFIQNRVTDFQMPNKSMTNHNHHPESDAHRKPDISVQVQNECERLKLMDPSTNFDIQSSNVEEGFRYKRNPSELGGPSISSYPQAAMQYPRTPILQYRSVQRSDIEVDSQGHSTHNLPNSDVPLIHQSYGQDPYTGALYLNTAQGLVLVSPPPFRPLTIQQNVSTNTYIPSCSPHPPTISVPGQYQPSALTTMVPACLQHQAVSQTMPNQHPVSRCGDDSLQQTEAKTANPEPSTTRGSSLSTSHVPVSTDTSRDSTASHPHVFQQVVHHHHHHKKEITIKSVKNLAMGRNASITVNNEVSNSDLSDSSESSDDNDDVEVTGEDDNEITCGSGDSPCRHDSPSSSAETRSTSFWISNSDSSSRGDLSSAPTADGTARSTDETSEELINTTGFPDLSLNHAGQGVNNLT